MRRLRDEEVPHGRVQQVTGVGGRSLAVLLHPVSRGGLRDQGVAELARGDGGTTAGDGYSLPLTGDIAHGDCGKQSDQRVRPARWPGLWLLCSAYS